MKDYHNAKKIDLGYSDMARLILAGPDSVEYLNFGEDNEYRAYLLDLDDGYTVPTHYDLRYRCDTVLDIYDDVERVCNIRASRISVYRCGEMGVLIAVSGLQSVEALNMA